jgi:crotonobetainyl-CoA:carnitine CoA-transferase CaiB-like acyl-CoA transferase
VTWSAYGTRLERDGNRGAPGAPQGVYACAGDEQWVALSITDDDEWRSLVEIVDDPALAASSIDALRRTRSMLGLRDGSRAAIATRPWTRCWRRACSRRRCGIR